MLTGLDPQNLRFLSLRFLTFALLGYCFFAITTIHHAVNLTANLPIENLLVSLVLVLGSIVFILSSREQQRLFLPYFIVTFPMIITPLLSSIYNNDLLGIFYDPEYRTMAKMLVVAPWLFFVMQDPKIADVVTRFFVISFSLLGAYFLYRFLILEEVREFDLRPVVNIRHGDPNFLATFFVTMIPIAFYQTITLYKKRPLVISLVFATCTVLLIFCLVMTQSRMAILAFLISSIFLLTKKIKVLSKKTLFFLIILSIGLAFTGRETLQRFRDLNDKSNIDRVSTLINGFKVFADDPVIGVGMHKSQTYFFDNTNFPDFQTEVSPLDIHNSFLKSLADLGVIGAIAYLLLFLLPVKNIIFSKNESAKPYLQASLLALTLCLMSVGATYKDLIILLLFYIALMNVHSKSWDSL